MNDSVKKDSSSEPLEGHQQVSESLLEATPLKTCFVIMPISDPDGYEMGHFQRVYEFIIKPACEIAGFKAIRANEVKSTNVIIVDILERILSSDMAICDLSSNNPNVLYELGIRQAFDMPVSIIKDDITNRIFDINTIRDLQYSRQLRFDQVNNTVNELASAITQTYNSKDKELNSLVGLLGREKAKVKPTTLSDEVLVILDAIKGIDNKVSSPRRGVVSPMYTYELVLYREANQFPENDFELALRERFPSIVNLSYWYHPEPSNETVIIRFTSYELFNYETFLKRISTPSSLTPNIKSFNQVI